MYGKTIFAVALLLLANLANAQDSDDWTSWPMGDKFVIYGNAFFPRLDTQVRFDAANGEIGTTVDFEQNLGMSDSEALPGVGFIWRFAKKHRVRFDAFNLLRSGSAITSSEIRFGGEVYQVDLPISSFFDTKVRSIAYSYSLIFDEKKELAFTAGLSVQDIRFGLIGTGPAGIIESDGGLTAPVPSFGLSGGYAFNDKWVLRGGLGYFGFSLALENDEELSGHTATANIMLQHNTFENVHFGVGLNYFDINVDFVHSRRNTSLSYRYFGPALLILGTF